MTDHYIRTRLIKSSLLGGLLCILLSGSAWAQQTDVDPAMPPAFSLQVLQRLDQLESQVMQQTGQNEELRHELEKARAAITRLEADLKALETRFYTLEATQAAAHATESPTQNTQPPQAQQAQGDTDPIQNIESVSFEEARGLLLAGDFSGAEQALHTYVYSHPEGPHTPEAHYWLGEIAYNQGRSQNAAQHYLMAVKQAPKGVRTPDAMAKLAASLRALGKTTEACSTLRELNMRFPQPARSVQKRAEAEWQKAGCEA